MRLTSPDQLRTETIAEADGHFVWSVGTEQVQLDGAARNLLGLPSSLGELPPLHVSEFAACLEDGWADAMSTTPDTDFVAKLAAGCEVSCVLRRRRLRLRARVVGTTDGRPTTFAGTLQDRSAPVAPSERSDPRVASRLDLLRLLADSIQLGDSPDQTVELAVAGLAVLFEGCRIIVSRVDPEGRMHVVHDRPPHGMPVLQGAVIDLAGAPAYLSRLRGPGWLVCNDVALEPCLAPLAEALAQVGVYSVVDSVFDATDGTVTMLCVDGPAPRIWPEGELETVRAVAGELRLAAEVSRAREAQRQAELELQRAQRVDALGRLAGGIAHEFNNTLQVVQLNVYDARDALATERHHDVKQALNGVDVAADRAAKLARRLMTFTHSGDTMLALEPVVLSDILHDTASWLRRLLPEDRLIEVVGARDARVMADPQQLEQALVNVVVNAREATNAGGKIRVEIARLVPSASVRRTFDLGATKYLALTVSDDGRGMSGDVAERAFEPFFSAWSSGDSTGLGLTMVWAIAKHHGGGVSLESTEGQGTSVTLWLPILKVV